MQNGSVSQAEYARLKGLSRGRVSQLKGDGLLVLDASGKVDVVATDALLEASLDPLRGGDRVAKCKEAVRVNSLLSARIADTLVRAARREREASELAAASVLTAAATEEAEACLQEALAALRELAAALSGTLHAAYGDAPAIHAMLTDATRRICLTLAEASACDADAPAPTPAGEIVLPPPSKEAYVAAQARDTLARAQVSALEEYLETGYLAPAKAVRERARDRATAAREALLSLPDRNASAMAVMESAAAIADVLEREIGAICRELIGPPAVSRETAPAGDADSELRLPPLGNGPATVRRGWAHGWRMPEVLALDVWSDRYRRLPQEGSAEYGPWRTDRNPPQREIMQALGPDDPCERVSVMAGTQVGKTEVGTNWLLSIAQQTPAPTLAVFSSIPQAKRWSRQRLEPSIKLIPEVAALVRSPRDKEGGGGVLSKQFPGGLLAIAGSHSAHDLSSMPVRYLYLDEIDRYPPDVDDEGHPVDVATRRTSSFVRRKILGTSSPKLAGSSRIAADYELSDQRTLQVPCPHCEHLHALVDERLTEHGTFVCPACGAEIDEGHKPWMLAHSRWVARFPERSVRHKGYHWPSCYAPVGLGYSWREIAEMRAEARTKPEKRKNYINAIWALPFDDPDGVMDWEEIKARAGGHALRTLPRGCLFLTAAVDTQDNRLVVLLLGWGRGERCWVIDALELPGNPGDEQVWADLDTYLARPIVNEFGVALLPEVVCVDSGGHYTHTVYQYTRARRALSRIAIKGDRYPNKPVLAGRPRSMDINVGGNVIHGGAELWFVGTDTGKGHLWARLRADGDAAQTRGPDDYRVRFPAGLPDEFYRQLCGERYDRENNRWLPIQGVRHDWLDCWVYGFAAANYPTVRIATLTELDWREIEARVEPRIVDLFATPAAPAQAAPTRPASPAPPPTSVVPVESRETRTPRAQGDGGFGRDEWYL